RELATGRLVCVFGCGGDRDRGKRPLMGHVATAHADVAIVTSDNPRSEDPDAIIAEVLEGAGPRAEAIVDRRAAIDHAIEHADAARCAQPGALLAAEDPLRALQALATAWRRELGARVIGVTGSTGKTTTKDILAAMLRPHRRTVANRQNLNTDIGLPLTVLEAPADTEVLVLEMGMRGIG